MTTMDCETVRRGELVERYVTERLEPDQAEAFEAHYLTCVRCQSELRAVIAVRALERRARRRKTRRRIGGSVLAVAATVTVILLARGGAPTADVARLGAVSVAPAYLGIPVRTDDEPADALFADAMQAYLAGDHVRGVDLLRRVTEEDPGAAAPLFFLGASLLMTGENEAALNTFERVIAAGATPYQGEAYYYAAKALLRLGRGNDALRHLEAAAALENDIAGQARALADSVLELAPR